MEDKNRWRSERHKHVQGTQKSMSVDVVVKVRGLIITSSPFDVKTFRSIVGKKFEVFE